MNLHEEIAMKTEALKRIDKIINNHKVIGPKELNEIWWIARTALGKKGKKQDK